MPTTLKVTIEQGWKLLQLLSDAKWPESLDRRKYPRDERVACEGQLRQAFKALREVSPVLREEKIVCFGPRDAWTSRASTEEERRLGVDPMVYALANKTLLVDVSLSGEARKGVERALLLWVHPMSRNHIGAGRQEELAWPLAEQLGITKDLEAEIGAAPEKAAG